LAASSIPGRRARAPSMWRSSHYSTQSITRSGRPSTTVQGARYNWHRQPATLPCRLSSKTPLPPQRPWPDAGRSSRDASDQELRLSAWFARRCCVQTAQTLSRRPAWRANQGDRHGKGYRCPTACSSALRHAPPPVTSAGWWIGRRRITTDARGPKGGQFVTPDKDREPADGSADLFFAVVRRSRLM